MTYLKKSLDFTQTLDGATNGRQPWQIQVDTPGVLHARLVDPGDTVPRQMTVAFDDVDWATLPTSPVGDGLELVCSMPPALPLGPTRVVLRDADSGRPLARASIDNEGPCCNPHGIPSSDVFDITAHAMFSVPWVEFDGACLTVTGAHLPPAGDPGRLSVAFNDGVVGDFEYPLASPEFGAHYWYWPNAHFSGFRVRIDLTASNPESDAFSFRFVDRAQGAARRSSWADRGRIWIPRDMGRFMGFPQDTTQLSRVQTWSNGRTVAFTGYNAFKTFESLLRKHGIMYRPGLRLLDWGCGHGRVTRHFIADWPEADVCGTDIDRENIEWCQANLQGGTFTLAPLWPPMHEPDEKFDVIIGLSVMTHLTQDAQEGWINEIRRILKPGGLALITFGGHGAAAYASIHQTQEWWAMWRAAGFDAGQIDTALDGKIPDPTYYRITHQTPLHARTTWSRAMTVVDVEPQAFGYQDVAVLRAP